MNESLLTFLVSTLSKLFVARQQLLNLSSDPPSIIPSKPPPLPSTPRPLLASVDRAFVTQSEAALNSVSHPPPAASCTTRHRECNTASHTHARTTFHSHTAHASPLSTPLHPHCHTDAHNMNEIRRWGPLWLKQKILCQDVSAEIRGRKY